MSQVKTPKIRKSAQQCFYKNLRGVILKPSNNGFANPLNSSKYNLVNLSKLS